MADPFPLQQVLVDRRMLIGQPVAKGNDPLPITPPVLLTSPALSATLQSSSGIERV